MNIVEFLEARIAEDEDRARTDGATAMVGAPWKHHPEEAYNDIQERVLNSSRRMLAECRAKRAIIEFHKNWPVLIQGPLRMEEVDSTDPSTLTYRAVQEIQWATQQQYIDRFGTEPPTAPILAHLASVYADHPDYREEWGQ